MMDPEQRKEIERYAQRFVRQDFRPRFYIFSLPRERAMPWNHPGFDPRETVKVGEYCFRRTTSQHSRYQRAVCDELEMVVEVDLFEENQHESKPRSARRPRRDQADRSEADRDDIGRHRYGTEGPITRQ